MDQLEVVKMVAPLNSSVVYRVIYNVSHVRQIKPIRALRVREGPRLRKKNTVVALTFMSWDLWTIFFIWMLCRKLHEHIILLQYIYIYIMNKEPVSQLGTQVVPVTWRKTRRDWVFTIPLGHIETSVKPSEPKNHFQQTLSRWAWPLSKDVMLVS